MADEAGASFVDRLSDRAHADLVERGRRRHYEAGDVIFRAEDDGSQVMLLQRGLAKVSVAAPSGREVILEILDAGCVLGELSAVDGGLRSATVTALTPVDVLAVSQGEFLDFLREHGDAATALLQLVVAKLRGAVRRQLEFGTADALGRLCRALVELADRYGQDTSDGRRFEMPMTQQDLASYAGLSREAVVKGLSSLRSLGWIDTHGRMVDLRDLPAISARADGN